MTQAQKLIEALKQFRDAREWAQFHNTKDLALALSIEAAELNEQPRLVQCLSLTQ